VIHAADKFNLMVAASYLTDASKLLEAVRKNDPDLVPVWLTDNVEDAIRGIKDKIEAHSK
jgi:hypothetical protein